MNYFAVFLNLFNLKPLLLIPGKARIVDSVVAKFNLILVVQIFGICVVYSGYSSRLGQWTLALKGLKILLQHEEWREVCSWLFCTKRHRPG